MIKDDKIIPKNLAEFIKKKKTEICVKNVGKFGEFIGELGKGVGILSDCVKI